MVCVVVTLSVTFAGSTGCIPRHLLYKGTENCTSYLTVKWKVVCFLTFSNIAIGLQEIVCSVTTVRSERKYIHIFYVFRILRCFHIHVRIFRSKIV
jgi:hypothetical protein